MNCITDRETKPWGGGWGEVSTLPRWPKNEQSWTSKPGVWLQRLDCNRWALLATWRTPGRLRKQPQLSVSRSPSQGSPSIRLMVPEQIQDSSPHPPSLIASPSSSIPHPRSSETELTWSHQDWLRIWPGWSGHVELEGWSSPSPLAHTHQEMFLVDYNIHGLLQQLKLAISLYFYSLFPLALYSLWSRNSSPSRKGMPWGWQCYQFYSIHKLSSFKHAFIQLTSEHESE